jgi:multiple sugar transport system permease protein
MAEITIRANSFVQQRSGLLKRRRMWENALGHLIIWAIAVFFITPIVWMFFTALKPDQDVFRFPPNLLPYDNLQINVNGETLPVYDVTIDGETRRMAMLKVAEGHGDFIDPANPDAEPIHLRMKFAEPVLAVGFQWHNFLDAVNRGVRPGLNVNFWTYFKNSLILAFWVIVGTLVSCAPVAYGFSRIHWPGRDLIFILVLSTMMLPFQVTMIPVFLFFTETLRWGDTLLPIIVPAFFANAFDIFLLRQFFRTIPEELLDAARVDGASEFHIFLRIVLPLSKPVLATITVFTFLWAWNLFLEPLLYLNNPEHFTLALGLQDYQAQHKVIWNQMMAASVIFTVPVVIAFFFAQRTFIEGIKLTGTKG